MKARLLALVEKTLDEVLPAADARPAVLSEAMRYAVGTGGKRLRPLICLASAVAVGGKAEDAEKLGVTLAEKLLAAGGQEILQELGLLQNK